MGQRYRFTFNEAGDVLDPSSWVEDNNELAGELNGYLDRDNFGSADIVQAEIVANAFTMVESFGSTTTFAADRTNTGWQGGGATGASGIFREDITATVDCGLCCEMNVSWAWAKTTAQYSVTGGGPTGTPWTVSTFTVDTIQFRILVDGLEVARSGLFEDMHHNYGTYLVGATVVTSGVHIVSVECSLNRRRWEGLAQDGANTYAVNITQRNLVITQERR